MREKAERPPIGGRSTALQAGRVQRVYFAGSTTGQHMLAAAQQQPCHRHSGERNESDTEASDGSLPVKVNRPFHRVSRARNIEKSTERGTLLVCGDTPQRAGRSQEGAGS